MTSVDSLELEDYLDIEDRDPRKFQRGTLFRLCRLILKHKYPLLMGIFMVALGTFTTLLEPRIFGYAIDEAIVPKQWEKLQIIVVVFLVVTGIRVVSTIQQSYFFELLGQKVTQDLRVMLFSHLERMPISVYDKNPAGRFLTRVTNDVAALNEMFSSGFVSILCNILLVVGILVWLMALDLRLGLIASSLFPLLVGVSIYFSRKLKLAYRDSRSKLSALNAFLAENLSGIKIIHLFNRQHLHMKRFERLNQWYADAQVNSIRVFAVFQPVITITAGISMALIIWYGGQETHNGTLKLGVLVAFFSYSLSLFQPVREIADKWNVFLSGMASAERVFAALEWSTEMSERDVRQDSVPISDLMGKIEFQDVWFAYEGENWILKDFSLEIQPGQKVGIVGHTGAGKSTLISLLMRFYEPQKGKILIDGKDIRTYDKRSLRASIGIVQQDVFLFSGTFKENITFWKDMNDEHLYSLLSSIQVPKSKTDCLQERGSNFSMGERQMIAFARALAANPRIWILDEATSNMDTDTEMSVQNALESASKDRTSIVIAHRLATVKAMDRILVLNKGALVESGTHLHLMAQNGLYARLYRYQETMGS